MIFSLFNIVVQLACPMFLTQLGAFSSHVFFCNFLLFIPISPLHLKLLFCLLYLYQRNYIADIRSILVSSIPFDRFCLADILSIYIVRAPLFTHSIMCFYKLFPTPFRLWICAFSIFLLQCKQLYWWILRSWLSSRPTLACLCSTSLKMGHLRICSCVISRLTALDLCQ